MYPPIGTTELLLILVAVVVIFGLTKLPGLLDGLNDRFDRLMRRRIYVTGRIDSDNQFQTQDWREPKVGAISDDEHRNKIFCSFVGAAIGIFLGLLLTWLLGFLQ